MGKFKKISLITVSLLIITSLGYVAFAKNYEVFKTKELNLLEEHKNDVDKNGKTVPDYINKKIELEEKHSEKLAKEKPIRENEVVEIKDKFDKFPKDANGKPILPDVPEKGSPKQYDDVGMKYGEGHGKTFFPNHTYENYVFTGTITTPYTILIAGSISKDTSIGFIYAVNNNFESEFYGRHEFKFEGTGAIELESYDSVNNIVNFSYNGDKKGYFDLNKNEAVIKELIVKESKD